MMEELNLLSNRGSIMFHERLKRVERFTLENIADRHINVRYLTVVTKFTKAIYGLQSSIWISFMNLVPVLTNSQIAM